MNRTAGITDYRTFCARQERNGVFCEHIAGDVSAFRYPHMKAFQQDFSYEPDRKYWKFMGEEKGPGKIAAEDITLYEFLSPHAMDIHRMDMTGVPYGDEERQKAFEEVCQLYDERGTGFPGTQMQTVLLKDCRIRLGFERVAQLYEDLADVPVRMCVLKDVRNQESVRKAVFPFGSMLKGTDLVFTDGNALNCGQDLLHALYHLKEGIPGVNNDNMYVKEIWADVPSLYALQLSKGRMSRRQRMVPSPHPVHFTDYIWLRAYLGQAFVPEDTQDLLSPVYGIIEPALRLMMYVLDQSAAAGYGKEKNAILADAVLADRTEKLRLCFDGVLGRGSFEKIFDTYGIYEKYDRAQAYLKKDDLDRIMFDGPPLLPTGVSPDTAERIWKDKAYRNTFVSEI